jgi:C4-dicarboxylate-specific signal transduction histidine kinase
MIGSYRDGGDEMRLCRACFAPEPSRDAVAKEMDMAVKKVALANRWVSVTDVLDRLRRARENREQQEKLLDSLEGRVRQRRDDVERSLADLSPAQRSQIVSRAANGYRAELTPFGCQPWAGWSGTSTRCA